MIILFDEYETQFTSLGLGVLKDATNCVVKETLNGEFELEMSYDISGSHYNLLKENRIILAEPNPWTEAQPFRIDKISKPINGIVEISAKHISYDLNYIPYKVVDAKTLLELLDQLQNGKIVTDEAGNTSKERLSLINHNFTYTTNIISSGTTFKTTGPCNMRAMLMGDDEKSIIAVYNAELEFNKFNINLLSKRGKNRGAEVRYGHNMTDLKQETSCDKLYNGVFPYYHKETTKNEQTTEDSFKKAYIVGTKPLQDGWLSFVEGGDPYHPLDTTPVQIATEGDYFDKVYSWNITKQYYEEKLYNQTVMLIENAIVPGWIKIDWSKFPNVRCVANARGYYKTITDTEWGELKGVGDVIFEGNVLKQGLSGIATNMIIYYSEVIPTTREATNEEVTEIVDIQLDDPIIWINTPDAKAMRYNKILSLDLTSEFEEDPSQEALKQKAEEYIAKNKVGTLYITTEVSFVEIESYPDIYRNFNHIELGDEVHVVYNDLGVDCNLRVISYEYNVNAGIYNKIELGVKPDTLSTQSIENGDNISSLTNDIHYTDITTVSKLIAETVSADFINAANATLSKAQIEELSVSKINCPGIIEASQYSIDYLVAKLLVADNAEIKETLKAGNVEIAGALDIINGTIDMHSEEPEDGSGAVSYFEVDRQGNVYCNSLEIGDRDNPGMTVNADGTIECKNISVSGDSDIKIGDDKYDNVITELKTWSLQVSTVDFSRDTDLEKCGSMYGVLEKDDQVIATITISLRKFSDFVYLFDAKSDIDIADPISLTFNVESKGGLGRKFTDQVTFNDITLTGGAEPENIGSFSTKHMVSGSLTITKINLISPNPTEKVSEYIYKIDISPYVDPRIECTTNFTPEYDSPKNLNLGLDIDGLRWHAVYTETGTNTSSDKKLKNSINYNISNYDSFFDALKPCVYKLNKGTSDRLHMGMIAQDVEKALLNNNLTTQDFAGITKSIKKESKKKSPSKLRDKDYSYGLRYEEFIALLIYEVQKLKQEIKELKEGGNQDV